MPVKVQHTQLRGHAVTRDPLLNKGSAFTPDERRLLGITGMLPPTCNTQDQQAKRVYDRLTLIDDPLDRYRELAALHDRNEHLYYRLLLDHLAELMPIVYTPTVGLATQKFSEVFQRGRGVWITPAERGRIREVLEAAAEGNDVCLTVVTDNESILGIGDQGAGGMAISVGKLSLYTAGAGIDPAATLPISLDVGTNNKHLLQHELYLGWKSERMTGQPYHDLVAEFVEAFTDLFPRALIQWEDLRKDNALTILERYRHEALSFNDDIQGTGAVALAGILSALRVKGEKLTDQRIVVYGAGAAGLGIARQIKAALRLQGVADDELFRCLGVLDSRGLLIDDRPFSDAYKAELAWPHRAALDLGIDEDRGLEAVVERYRPTVLIGTSGQAGAFHEAAVRTMARAVETPLIMPMSNPTSNCEAVPADLVRWTNGRVLMATGSPFAPVKHAGRTIHVGQGNNVFVFPALGLGSLLAAAREVSDEMITRAAQSLAEQVTDEELSRGLLYPDVTRLRDITAVSAAAVCAEAFECGLARADPPESFEDAARAAMWTPDYPTFL